MPTKYYYLAQTPTWMKWVGVLILVVSAVVMGSALWSGVQSLTLLGSVPKDLESLGQLGDFFGGHTSAFAGSLTLLAVLFFSYHTAKQQYHFFEHQTEQNSRTTERQFFLGGIDLITQWDIKSPGCDQAMRLLDYYSRLALQANDEELLLIINTVITAELRKNVEGKNGKTKSTNYPFALEAIERIRPIRERDSRAQRARLASLETPPSAGDHRSPADRSSTVASD